MKAFATLLGLALIVPVGTLTAQDQDHKSPDLQQQSHPENTPPTDAHTPGANPDSSAGSGNVTDRSADQKQDQQGKSSSKKHKHKKTADDAHQAHGTPSPTPPNPDK